jgi:hypothetical protein
MTNDTDNKIFEPDVTLSAEIFGDRSGPQSPERSLMIAGLEDAARCLLRSCTATVDRKLRALYDETREWFGSSSTTELYDYENVCAVLGIDADWLRERLFGLVDRQRAETAWASPTPDAREPDDVVPPVIRASA